MGALAVTPANIAGFIALCGVIVLIPVAQAADEETMPYLVFLTTIFAVTVLAALACLGFWLAGA